MRPNDQSSREARSAGNDAPGTARLTIAGRRGAPRGLRAHCCSDLRMTDTAARRTSLHDWCTTERPRPRRALGPRLADRGPRRRPRVREADVDGAAATPAGRPWQRLPTRAPISATSSPPAHRRPRSRCGSSRPSCPSSRRIPSATTSGMRCSSMPCATPSAPASPKTSRPGCPTVARHRSPPARTPVRRIQAAPTPAQAPPTHAHESAPVSGFHGTARGRHPDARE